MAIPDNEIGRDFILASPGEYLGSVINRLLKQGGNDYSFLLLRTDLASFKACQVGKLKLRLKFFSENDLFTKKLGELISDFTDVPVLQQAEANLSIARQLAQKNSLGFLVVMDKDTVAGYVWLVRRTVYPGISLGEVFQTFQTQFPSANDLIDSGEPKSAKPRAERNVVNTGFTTRDDPKTLLDKTQALTPASEYYFILGVGEVLVGSIEKTPTSLPEHLPAHALLQVVLFDFEGELTIDPQASIGLLELQEDGSASIVRQPGTARISPEIPWLQFPITTPALSGLKRLRCSIYFNQCLVQSRLVSAQVFPVGEYSGEDPALLSELDYNLSQSMAAGHLMGIQEHRLSLMINDNGNGTHGFRFFGKDEFKSDVSIDGQELQGLIDYARSVFRKTAWGDENEYSGQTYRYAGSPDLNRFKDDLCSLAVRGYRIYDQLINKLAGGQAQTRKLSELMSARGLVQIALKQSARFVLPAALIYDYPLDSGADSKDYKLCPEFSKALAGQAPLDQCICFDGKCPSKGDDITICPSGFWGFRQDLGMPLSLAEAPDAPTEITVQGSPNYVISVCLDPSFIMRAGHEARLKNLLTQVQWTRVDSRDTTFDAMKVAQPHLVYFYCHGGLTSSKVPFIQIGSMSERGITRDNLRAKGVFWENPRPLVFINGCHTTALEPDSAFELVSGFVEVAGASGVIGTEITIFEPIATAFAESFLQYFSQGVGVGEAIRRSRLALLKQSNPLGLVYIPYTMAGLHIKM
jgi:hypothetical protein